MITQLKYMPVFRGRQEEIKVLKSFDFGSHIFPCLEIIKEVDRKPPLRKNKEGIFNIAKKQKTFEEAYIPLIEKIKAERVFVDLPIHLNQFRETKKDTLLFLRNVINKREVRTDYLKKFSSISSKIIPVISTYSEKTNEIDSISKQERDLRKYYGTIAFRTFFKTFSRDILQIKNVAQKHDYVIMDWEEMELDLSDGDINDIVNDLKTLNCNITVHRNPFPKDIRLSHLVHTEIINTIDNSHINNYTQFAGESFSDYVGIKKDDVTGGGVVSPGFIYYDATENNFYGYRFKHGSHKKGEKKPNAIEFETTIIPAVINSEATRRMQLHSLDFLGPKNIGWKIINNIALGEKFGGESGRSAAKFKRISMEHYLHCIKTIISNGDLN